MTDFEIELRELLNKYKMKVHSIRILFNNYSKNILEIVFEDEDGTGNRSDTGR